MAENSDARVRAAVPGVLCDWHIEQGEGKVYVIYARPETGEVGFETLCVWQDSEDSAWDATLLHPRVVAFEASRRVTQEGKPSEIERMEERRNSLLNNFGNGAFRDGRNREAIEALNRDIEKAAAKPLTPDSPKDAFEEWWAENIQRIYTIYRGNDLITFKALAHEAWSAALSGNRPEGDAKVEWKCIPVYSGKPSPWAARDEEHVKRLYYE